MAMHVSARRFEVVLGDNQLLQQSGSEIVKISSAVARASPGVRVAQRQLRAPGGGRSRREFLHKLSAFQLGPTLQQFIQFMLLTLQTGQHLGTFFRGLLVKRRGADLRLQCGYFHF